jgi:type II secretory pathway predicted ATPase ExeA
MYLEHYNLLEKPFEMSPGPRFLWLGEKHLEALATLKYGIYENKGFLLLTGDVGVGKTALIHRLMKEIYASKVVAYVPNPGLEPLDFFNLLANELRIDKNFSSKGAFLIEFKRFLIKRQAENKKVLLVIDEAQRLYHELLEEIRLFSNIELENRKLINIFFVGQPEFNQILLEPRNRAVKQRIAVRYQVEPLNQEETSHYIYHRMQVAGATRKIFTSNAILDIFKFSSGCPRLINIICDHALLTGYAADLKIINSSVIKECEPELKIPEDSDTLPEKTPPAESFKFDQIETPPSLETTPKPKYRIHPVLIGLLGILIGFSSYYLLWPTNHISRQTTTLQELTEPLDDKTKAIMGKRLSSNMITEVEQSSLPKGNEPITEEDPAPNKLNIDALKPAPELLADTQSAAASQSSVIQDTLSDKPINSDIPPEPPAEETISNELTDQADDELNTFDNEKQPVKDIAVAAEIDNSKSNTTVRTNVAGSTDITNTNSSIQEGVEDLTGKTNTNSPEKERVKDVQVPPTTPPLIALNDSLSVKEDTNNQNKISELNIVETSGAKQPSGSDNLSEEILTTQTKPGQFEEESTPPIIKQNEASDIKPQKPDNPTIEKPKIEIPQEVSDQKFSPPIKKEKPVTIAKQNVEAPEEKKTLAKLDPTLEAKLNNDVLEDRVRSFLKQYCNTYASKELGNFARLFGPDAKENGKSFSTLLPKYQRNFNAIEQIEYRIDLMKFDYEENLDTVKIEGKFSLRWRPYGQTWQENTGKIFMELDERGESFIVQRLDYYGDRRK